MLNAKLCLKMIPMLAAGTLAAGMVLTGCVERTILHGSHKSQKPTPRHAKPITVWFVRSKADELTLVPVERRTSANTSPKDRLNESVTALLAGPKTTEEQSGLGSEIPRGTILLGLESTKSGLELNLSQRFARAGGASSFETRLSQLRKTVLSATTEPVYLNVEGKRLTISEGEGIEIPQPINR